MPNASDVCGCHDRYREIHKNDNLDRKYELLFFSLSDKPNETIEDKLNKNEADEWGAVIGVLCSGLGGNGRQKTDKKRRLITAGRSDARKELTDVLLEENTEIQKSRRCHDNKGLRSKQGS